MEGRTRGGEGRGKGGMGKGKEKREVGGIAPWLLGDSRPCWQFLVHMKNGNMVKTSLTHCVSEILRLHAVRSSF